MIAIAFPHDSSKTRRTPGRKSGGGTVAIPDCRFGKREVCRRTFSSRRKILCKPLRGVVKLALTSFDLRLQQIIRCLTQHEIETDTDEDHHQHNRYDTGQEICHQESIADSPDEFSYEWPNECDTEKHKKDDEKNRKEIAADQRVARRREPDPVQNDRQKENQRDPLKPIESRESQHRVNLS